MANIENVTKLRDFLLTLPDENFDHGSWTGTAWENDGELIFEDTNICGTTACIGGWAAIIGKLIEPIYDEKDHSIRFRNEDYGKIQYLAGEWLGLSEKEAEILFMPWHFLEDNVDPKLLQYLEDEETTNAEAIAYLDKIIETGAVHYKYWKDVKEDRLG